MLRSAASRVLRSALVSIAAAACLVSAAELATLRLCCATVRAVRSIGSVFGCAEAMPDNARAEPRVLGRNRYSYSDEPSIHSRMRGPKAIIEPTSKTHSVVVTPSTNPPISGLHAGGRATQQPRRNFIADGTCESVKRRASREARRQGRDRCYCLVPDWPPEEPPWPPPDAPPELLPPPDEVGRLCMLPPRPPWPPPEEAAPAGPELPEEPPWPPPDAPPELLPPPDEVGRLCMLPPRPPWPPPEEAAPDGPELP